MIVEGTSLREIAHEHPGTFARYHRGFEALRAYTAGGRDGIHDVDVEVRWGPPGSGKTRYFFEKYGPELFIVSPPRDRNGSVWFDGFDGAVHSAVLFDDFYGWYRYNNLLRICDRYPFNVEIKGGTVPMSALSICFTCNSHPKYWFNNGRCDLAALERRISRIIYVGDNTYPTEESWVSSDKYRSFLPSWASIDSATSSVNAHVVL